MERVKIKYVRNGEEYASLEELLSIYPDAFKQVSGDFYEGQYVTVEFLATGKQYTRKVKYSKKYYADLFITINGLNYTKIECVSEY